MLAAGGIPVRGDAAGAAAAGSRGAADGFGGGAPQAAIVRQRMTVPCRFTTVRIALSW
jgi:hypothetical protein